MSIIGNKRFIKASLYLCIIEFVRLNFKFQIHFFFIFDLGISNDLEKKILDLTGN